MKYRKLQKAAFIMFVSAILLSLFAYFIFGDNFELNEIRYYIQTFGIWAPLVFIAIYVLGTIFIPSTPFMAVAGILFGFKYGSIYTIVGGLLSAMAVFTISRKLEKRDIDRLLKSKHLKLLEKYDERLERDGTLDLIILRILPIMPFNILNLIMGISKIKPRNYVLGTLIGLIPSIAITVYFGELISKVF